MVPWRFILADPLQGGAEIGEIFQARARRCTRPLDGLKTASLNIDLDNPVLPAILGATIDDRINLLLKAYRGSRRMFVGPITAGEIVSTAGESYMSLAAAGALWHVNGRLLGKTGPYGDGTSLATKDLGLIAHNLLAVINAEDDTGMRPGLLQPSSSGFVGPWHFKPAGEAIVELGPGLLGGYDFDDRPVEPVVDVDGLKIAELDIFGSKGQHRPNAVFEHGTGKRNVEEFRLPITYDGGANRAFALPPGYPDSQDPALTVQSAQDAGAIAARRLRETVIPGDFGPNSLRLAATQEAVRLRSHPREQVIFRTVPNLDLDYGTDFEEGDTIVGRAVRHGITFYDGVFRLYGCDFTIADTGSEQIDVTLVNEA